MSPNTDHERNADALFHMVTSEVARQDVRVLLKHERLVNWIARDLRAGCDSATRQEDRRMADAFVSRIRGRTYAATAERQIPQLALSIREPDVKATVAQSIQAASFARCAPLLDLAAAAGNGRALWDEMCEEWLVMPDNATSGKHVAIRVAGESMLPVLQPRDVVLVKLDAAPKDGDMVVARLDDDTYVVKRFERPDDRTVELLSFNAAFSPISIDARSLSILGVVIARFRMM